MMEVVYIKATGERLNFANAIHGNLIVHRYILAQQELLSAISYRCRFYDSNSKNVI